ncbi:MAG TPA: CHAT domain-containing protein [Blastocatellia bacterium]
MKQIATLMMIVALAFFVLHSTGSAQTATDKTASPGSPPQEEADRIDRLITECRQLLASGSFAEVSARAEEALALSRKIGDKLRQSRSLNYVALAAFHGGRTEEAIEPFKHSAALAGEAGDTKLEAIALNSAGALLVHEGHYEDGLYFYSQSLALCRDQKDRRGEATVLRNIALIYTKMRDYPKAYDALQNSLKLSRDLSLHVLEYAALVRLAGLETDRRNFESALNYTEQAFRLESPNTDPTLKLLLRNVLAGTHLEMANLEKSAGACEQALDIARKQKMAVAEGVALGNLALVQLKSGKTAQSLASSSQALTLLRRSDGDPNYEANILYTQSQAQRVLGKNEEALSSLRGAIALLERARLLSVPTETSRAGFFSAKGDIYLGAIDLLVALGKEGEALAVSEAYHARAFLDLLVESRADLRRVLSKELLGREEAILKRISSAQRDLWHEEISKDRKQQLMKELASAEEALEQFQLEVRRSNPQYASLKPSQTYGTVRIQRELLDPGTALVEYVVGEEKSFAWLVSRDKVSYSALPGKKELTNLVVEFVKSLASRPPGPTEKQTIATLKNRGRVLYNILLHPFEKDLSSLRKLIVVPDNALAYLPFEALVTEGGSGTTARSGDSYLVERFAIAYAPSASALAAVREIHNKPVSKGLIAFGDPVYPELSSTNEHAPESRLTYYTERGLELRRLPYTRREVTSIGALFGRGESETFLGAQANEQTVKSASLDRYRYVHFAAHGVVDEENPGRSGIILSLVDSDKEDGILQMAEIMRLRLNADLVTLSACRTGLGKLVSGEGVLGLTRAFLYAGARSVQASLWNVNDTATSELMTAFYRDLKRGLSKDEALRQAKLEMLHGKQLAWRHPYFWASFVLIGEGAATQ